MNKPRLLIVNDDRLTQKSLYELLSRAGFRVEIAASLEESLTHLENALHRVVLADINKIDGLKLLKVIKEKAYPAEVIMLTSYGNTEAAVESIKMGAFDYLVHPVEDKKILSAIERAMARELTVPAAPVMMKRQPKQLSAYHSMVGRSPKMQEIYFLVERIADSRATVLLRGESGTGKRLVARAIHDADKRRKHEPFVEISCGALSRGLIESELFGHTRGSFTDAIADRRGRFELAHGGTILLDDIDALPLDLQVKLLRVLQHKEFERLGDHKTIKVDVRIIVSTNRELEKAVAEKTFREDLYYRLNVISVNVPPLRERKEDVPILAGYFLNLYARQNFKQINSVSKDTMDILNNYHWPGNIRELENIIERAVILDTDGVITREDLPEIISGGSAVVEGGLQGEKEGGSASLKEALKEPEKVYILKVLKEAGWNKKQAARRLGVNRTTLYNKLKKYHIPFSSNSSIQ